MRSTNFDYLPLLHQPQIPVYVKQIASRELNMIQLGTGNNGKSSFSPDPIDLLRHTAVIGQSGTGKSYFIARLLEEICLRTKARIVILDPNGDFSTFYNTQKSDFWNNGLGNDLANLDTAQEEDSERFDNENNFNDSWSKISQTILVPSSKYFHNLPPKIIKRKLMIHWQNLYAEQDFLLENEGNYRPKVYQGVATCMHYVNRHPEKFKYREGYSLEDLENIATMFSTNLFESRKYPEAFTLSESDWVEVRLLFRRVRKRFHKLWAKGALEGSESKPNDLMRHIGKGFHKPPEWRILTASLAGLDVNHMHLAASATLFRLWSASVNAWQKARDSIEDSNNAPPADTSFTVGGLDDSSLNETPEEIDGIFDDDDDKEITGDKRVPTFLVIDEAHNFAPEIPSNTLQAHVSDRISTIAAEGRKYGLFLILATQRPNKLRRGLLEECENACLLKIQSKLERERAADALGRPRETIEQNVGSIPARHAYVIGPWSQGDKIVSLAASRTVLGGGGIDKAAWVNE